MKYLVTLNNTNYEVEVEESKVSLISSAPVQAAPVAAPAAPVATPAAAPTVQQSTAAGEKVLSPMPGTILAINSSVGTAVKSGDVIMVLEAMKMENEIMAPCDGTVTSVSVAKGASVESGTVLCTIA